MLAFASLVASLAAASVAVAAPGPARLARRDDIDTTILQYALTLEHLENAFYSGALAKYSAADFAAAGFPAWVRKRVVQIGQHEAEHVAFLEAGLGSAATKACTYTFPYTSVTSFLGLSAAIENVGVTAYLGAANKITNPEYITAAGSILTVEARHQAWMDSAVLKGTPWNGPEDTPLGFSQVYSIVAPMIVACPSTNPTLPVTAFPAASISGSYTAGSTVKLTFPTTGKTEFLAVFWGLSSYLQPIAVDGTVTIPAGLQGFAYAVVTTASSAANVTDETTVAGPIILDFPFSSSASV